MQDKGNLCPVLLFCSAACDSPVFCVIHKIKKSRQNMYIYMRKIEEIFLYMHISMNYNEIRNVFMPENAYFG